MPNHWSGDYPVQYYAERPGSRIREQRENHPALRVSTRGLEQRG